MPIIMLEFLKARPPWLVGVVLLGDVQSVVLLVGVVLLVVVQSVGLLVVVQSVVLPGCRKPPHGSPST